MIIILIISYKITVKSELIVINLPISHSLFSIISEISFRSYCYLYTIISIIDLLLRLEQYINSVILFISFNQQTDYIAIPPSTLITSPVI